MKHAVKYAALNMGVLLFGFGMLLFGGAAVEGLLPRLAALGLAAGCAWLMSAAWAEVRRMERLARLARRAEVRRRKAAAACAAPCRSDLGLRVA